MRAVTALLLTVPPLLQGCGVIFDAIRGNPYPAVTEQPPEWGEPLQDSALEALALEQLRAGDPALRSAQITVANANGVVLLAGQVPAEASRQTAERIVRNIEGVRAVHNQLRVAANRSLDSRAEDNWTTTRVRAGLQRADPGLWERVKVVTDLGVVYLLGEVSMAAAARAEQLARDTAGVRRIVVLFEQPGSRSGP